MENFRSQRATAISRSENEYYAQKYQLVTFQYPNLNYLQLQRTHYQMQSILQSQRTIARAKVIHLVCTYMSTPVIFSSAVVLLFIPVCSCKTFFSMLHYCLPLNNILIWAGQLPGCDNKERGSGKEFIFVTGDWEKISCRDFEQVFETCPTWLFILYGPLPFPVFNQGGLYVHYISLIWKPLLLNELFQKSFLKLYNPMMQIWS